MISSDWDCLSAPKSRPPHWQQQSNDTKNICDAVVEPSSISERQIANNGVMKEWKHDGLCFRRVSEARDYKPLWKKYCTDKMRFSKLQFFELMVPKQYFITVMLDKMNKNLPVGVKQITYGEFLKFLGLWLLMAIIEGPQYQDYWSAWNKNLDDTISASWISCLNEYSK